MLQHNKSKIKAFGLLEILISLAIFAIGVIGITTMNVKSYKIIKNNELGDLANRTMIKTLEFFKSPTTTAGDSTQKKITDAFNACGGCAKVSFKIKSTSVFDPASDDYDPKLDFDLDNLTTLVECPSDSRYKITYKTNSDYTGFDLCNKIFIERKPDGFLITSRIVYTLVGKPPIINELIGYRPITD